MSGVRSQRAEADGESDSDSVCGGPGYVRFHVLNTHKIPTDRHYVERLIG